MTQSRHPIRCFCQVNAASRTYAASSTEPIMCQWRGTLLACLGHRAAGNFFWGGSMKTRIVGVILGAAGLGVSVFVSPSHSATLYQSIPDLTVAPFDTYCSPCLGRGGGPIFSTFTLGSTSTINSISVVLSGAIDVDVSIWSVVLSGPTGTTPPPGYIPNSQLFFQTFTPAQQSTSVVPGAVTVNPTALGLSRRHI
jgi:hypothetical protein